MDSFTEEENLTAGEKMDRWDKNNNYNPLSPKKWWKKIKKG